MTTNSNLLLDVALECARRGWPVFPVHSMRDGQCSCGHSDCSNQAKHPRILNNLNEATTAPALVTGWWQNFPDANIGIATGQQAGLVVLDIDSYHGGDASLDQLEARHGKLPDTVEVLTGGGGRHIYFAHPGGRVPNSAGRLGPGLDIRGDGGYVIAPPSNHVSGRRYEWEASSEPGMVALAPVPLWLLDRLVQAPRMPSTAITTSMTTAITTTKICEGGRNQALASFAGAMRKRGATQATIESALLAYNLDCCVPPLPEPEVLMIARSIMRYEPSPIAVIGQAEEWGEPEALDMQLLPVKPFTPNLLPDSLRSYVLDCANRIQCPPDFIATSLISSAGSVIGRQIPLRILEYDNWAEYANLWGLIIGLPSERKSPAMNAGLDPIRCLARAANKKHKEELENFKREDIMAKAEAEQLKKAIAQAIKNGGDASELKEQIKPCLLPPTERRFITGDITEAKLGELLVENPYGLLLAIDEITGWLKRLEEEGHKTERSFYMSGHSGKMPHNVDRIGRGSLFIPAVCISICGTIQPGVLATYVRDALKGGSGNDGFLQRFQLSVWPDPVRSSLIVDRYPDIKAQDRVCAIFDVLSNIDMEALGAKEGSSNRQHYLRFDEQAQRPAKEFLRKHREYWGNSTDHQALVSHAIKAEKTFAALALIFHLVDWAAGGPGGGVSVSALERAIKWIDYLESHARRIYGCATQTDQSALGLFVAKLKAGEIKDGFTARDIARHHWAGLSKSEDIEAVLAELGETNWVRVERIKTSGRTKTAYRINPKIK